MCAIELTELSPTKTRIIEKEMEPKDNNFESLKRVECLISVARQELINGCATISSPFHSS